MLHVVIVLKPDLRATASSSIITYRIDPAANPRSVIDTVWLTRCWPTNVPKIVGALPIRPSSRKNPRRRPFPGQRRHDAETFAGIVQADPGGDYQRKLGRTRVETQRGELEPVKIPAPATTTSFLNPRRSVGLHWEPAVFGGLGCAPSRPGHRAPPTPPVLAQDAGRDRAFPPRPVGQTAALAVHSGRGLGYGVRVREAWQGVRAGQVLR
jgi:hypothetical protein